MNEMIERVARAISVEDGVDPDGHEFGQEAKNWTANRDVALAALSSIREPTAAMIAAGAGSHIPDQWVADEDVAKAWRAMVDAALKETADV